MSAPLHSIGICPVCGAGLCGVRVYEGGEAGIYPLAICDECEAIWTEPDLDRKPIFPDPEDARSPVDGQPLWGESSHWADLQEIAFVGWDDHIESELSYHDPDSAADEKLTPNSLTSTSASPSSLDPNAAKHGQANATGADAEGSKPSTKFSKTKRAVVCYPVTDDCLRRIRQAAGDEYEVVNAGQERVDELLPTADIFIGHAKVPVDWDRVLRAGRLRWIQSSAAGLDHCLVPGVIDSDIVVCSASGLFAPQVAEQTFALLMGLLRRIRLFTEATRKREFIRLPTDDLRGKTVGIVGLGGNGRYIAKMLAPWGVRILATDFYPSMKPAEVERLDSPEGLPRLLAESDIVILALPLNASTESLFNESTFALMRPGSYLVNVARGGVVSEAALVAALDSGHIAGAGLDVTEVEPLPEESLLWDRSNVLITPHVGAQSYRRISDTTDLVCENLKRYRRGVHTWNKVDKRLGFPHPSIVWHPGV